MINFINLTPHDITILATATASFDPKAKCWRIEGEPVVARTIKPSGQIARVAMEEAIVGDDDGIVTVQNKYGEVQGLPEPQPDTIYIVSALVATAAKRGDLRIPARMVRNEAGQPVGCLALAKV